MHKRKILLINSYVKISKGFRHAMISDFREEPYPSLGLLYLAGALRKGNYDVSYLDIPAILKRNNLTFQDNIDKFVRELIWENLQSNKPHLVGINCLFSGRFPSTIYISSVVKEVDQSLPVVLGGVHPTVFHRRILEHFQNVDFVIIGEGEESFLQLLDALFSRKGSFSEIDGLCYRKNGKAVMNPKKKFICDLDNLPFPASDILKLEDYKIEQDKWQKHWHNPRGYKLRHRWPLLTSRSCPMRCNFCSMHLVHGPKIRFRSAQNCFAEIEWLYNQYGINYFSIIDDNFTINKRMVLELADKIRKAKLKIYIDTPNGVSIKFFDKEILEALKAMGLLRIFFAVESGSDYIRNRVMGKALPDEKIFEVFALMRREKDILVKAFFLVGMPQETAFTLKESYEMAKKLCLDDISVHFAVPFPGTALYEEVIKNNLLLNKEQDILLAENFHMSSDVPWIKPYNLEIQELIEFRNQMNDIIAERYAKLNIDKKYPIHHLL